MGLQGFSNNASGGMSPGDRLHAKIINNIAEGADKAQVGPSGGLVFTSSNGGLSMFIPPQDNQNDFGAYEQFQISVEPLSVGQVETPLSLIRVLKGTVIWKPSYPEELAQASCTTQLYIDTFYALPDLPIVPQDSPLYISGGGIAVPNGIDYGVYIFKCDGLPTDTPPIVVVMPKSMEPQGCPVSLPFVPPVEAGSWQMVVIGYVNWTTVEDASYFVVEQKSIGTLTLPGGGMATAGTAYLPPQLPANAIFKDSLKPFECRIDNEGGEQILKVGNGSISYTKSNMPYVGIGAWVNKFQAKYTGAQVVPSGWRTDDDSGYKIQGDGSWYLCAFYWDAVEGTGFTLPTPLKSGYPILAIVNRFGTDIEKIYAETGPGLYTNTMNIQRMSGYTSADTEEPWDWGHCHTTYFNPMKFGFDFKIIASIDAISSSQSQAQIFKYQSATDYQNEIQNIYFPVLPKDGFVIFTYDGVPSLPFYPAPWSGANDATNLFHSLQAIPALRGNIAVTRTSEKNFYVTFINNLQAVEVPMLVANNTGLQSFDYEYVIEQHHIGNLVLDASPKFDGTQIMNKPNVTSAEDPYVVQSNNTPAFDKIINREDVMACDGLSGDNDFTVGTYVSPLVDNDFPRVVTTHQWTYGEANGCDGDTCEHPFQVHKNGTSGESATWTVCAGTVNNKEPSNKDDVLTLQDGFIWIKCTASNTAAFPIAVTIESGTAVPADTDTAAYIVVASITAGEKSQLLSGSVWGDRIKVGTNTATYYYAGI